MFILKSGDTYSRGYLIISAALYVILSYLTRLIWKALIKKHGSPMWRRGKMIVVASPESAEGILTRLIENNVEGYEIAGLVFDKMSKVQEVKGIPVVARLDTVSEYLCSQWIDAVYIYYFQTIWCSE